MSYYYQEIIVHHSILYILKKPDNQKKDPIRQKLGTQK